MALHLHAIDPSPDPGDPAAESQRAAAAPRSGTAPAPRLMDWRRFHSELRRAAVAATQTGAPLSLLMLEPAGPGRRGERRGAGPGTAIGRLAGPVKAAVGERGLLARYDAERLAVILIDADLDAAIAGAESIARSLAAHPRGADGRVGLEASPAIGIAQFRDDESLGHLIQRTADALGRARVARGLAVSADRSAKARPTRPPGGAPLAAYALKDER